jgi:hypothetical protein
MMVLLMLCWRVYDLTLRFYPSGLCDGFGSEMSEIFRRQTLEAWIEDGWAGLRPVVWCATKEFFAEAIGPRARSAAVVSGATSLVFTSLTFVCLLWALNNPLAVKAVEARMQHELFDSGRTSAPSSGRHSNAVLDRL